jgi:hypothetical protein
MKSYQVRIALQHVRPIVRRRITVPGDLNFAQFAVILICAMGWQGYHEYAFRLEDRGITLTRGSEGGRFIDAMFSHLALHGDEKEAHREKIDRVFTEGYSFWFDYDFGDGWEHGVKIEKVMDGEQKSAMVTQFEGNCPPEDVGGPGGYEDFLRIINDKDDPEYEKMTEWGESQWYGDYDIGFVNAYLEALARRDYDETAMGDAYGEALFETEDSHADTAARFDPERGAYAGTGYLSSKAAFFGMDIEIEDGIPDSFGPNCIWRVIERFDDMTGDERNKALQNPETGLGFLSLGQSHSTDLRSVLQSLRENELKGVAEELELSLSGRRGKPALVDAISDFMADKNFFPSYLNDITNKERLDLIDEIMTSKEPYRITGSDHPYTTFISLRWMFAVTSWWDGYDLLIAPVDEMRGKYAEAIEHIAGMVTSIMDELDDCAKAAVNLYGIISLDEFADIFSSVVAADMDDDPSESEDLDGVNKDTVSDRLAEVIGMYEGGEADYFMSGGLLVHDIFRRMPRRDLKGVHEMLSAKPRRILQRDDFLKYADWSYYDETEAHRKLREYAERKVRSAKEGAKLSTEEMSDYADPSAMAEDIVREVSSAIRSMASYKTILKMFESIGDGFETKDEEEELISLLLEISKHSRTWELGGATPEELGEQPQTHIPYKKVGPKIGRNDPCPCGSGKKYKNCCGRN